MAIEITLGELRKASNADDPTDAWLINEDGTTFLDPADDISRWTVKGYWPRYLMRAGSVNRIIEAAGGEEQALQQLNNTIKNNL